MFLQKLLAKGSVVCLSFFTLVLGQATTATWTDHIPASGCKSRVIPGVEISYHHLISDIGPTDNVVWDDSMPFMMDLDIKVYGQLTVRPGNWIYGRTYSILNPNPSVISNSNNFPSSLIILEGGKAHMVGTKDSAIVMTGLGDDFRDINCFGPGVRGMWGGLTIKGKAPVCNAPYHGVYPMMEALDPYEQDSIITTYGHGNNPNDNSGEYAYLSVRHGGICIDGGVDHFYNGISLYGVGSGTTMHHIEVMSCEDDAIEIDGGTVNLKYVCSSFCDDDQFDIDQGYSGKMQYLFCVESSWKGNRPCEWDNLKHFDDPYHTATGPSICNMTLIGCGKYTTNTGDAGVDNQNYGANYIFQLADSMKGDFRNIVAMDQMNYAFWMRNHDLKPFGQAPIGNANGPKFSGLMVYHTKAKVGTTPVPDGANGDSLMTWNYLVYDDNGQAAASVAWLNDPANKCFCNVDPQLRGVSREFGFAALDPRPCAGSPALTPAVYVANPSDGFFDQTNYCGAFDPNAGLWCDGWTKLSQARCLSSDLSTYPELAIIPANASFDLAYCFNNPSLVPVRASVLLDGMDVTAIVVPALMQTYSQLPCGGTTARVPGIPVSLLGAANYFGLHVIKASFAMSDGRTLTGVSKIKMTN